MTATTITPVAHLIHRDQDGENGAPRFRFAFNGCRYNATLLAGGRVVYSAYGSNRDLSRQLLDTLADKCRITDEVLAAPMGYQPLHHLHSYASAASQAAIKEAVTKCIEAGYRLSVNDGEEWTVKKSADAGEILEAMATTSDIETLRGYTDGGARSYVCLLYCNGDECLNGYADHGIGTIFLEAFRKYAPEWYTF